MAPLNTAEKKEVFCNVIMVMCIKVDKNEQNKPAGDCLEVSFPKERCCSSCHAGSGLGDHQQYSQSWCFLGLQVTGHFLCMLSFLNRFLYVLIPTKVKLTLCDGNGWEPLNLLQV